jgi:hypothetical protein
MSSSLHEIERSFPRLKGSENWDVWKNRVVPGLVRAKKYYVLDDEDHLTVDVPPIEVEGSPPDTPTPNQTIPTVPPGTRNPFLASVRANAASTRLGGVSQRTNISTLTLFPRDPVSDRLDVWGTIFGTLEQSVIASLTPHARNPRTADPVILWRELHALFERTDGYTIAKTMGEIFGTKMAEGGDARAHLDILRTKQERLQNAGDGLSDRIFSFAMLQSLPPSYDTVTTPLYQLDPIIPDYIFKVIMREYERRPQSNITGDSASALAADGTGKGKKTYSKDKAKIANLCPDHPKGNHSADKCHKKLQKDLDEAQAKLRDMGWKNVGGDSKAAVARSGMGEDEAESMHGYCATMETWSLVGVVEGQIFHIDSGASHHMVTDSRNLQNMVPISKHQIHTGGRNTVVATHKGTIEVGNLLLKDVLYAPDLGFNLISVYRLAELGYKSTFEDGYCKI